MINEQTLLNDVKKGVPKAYEKLWGLYWPTLEAASGNLSNDPDWMQEAKIILFQAAQGWDMEIAAILFDDAVFERVQKAADHYRYINRKIQIREEPSPDEFLNEALNIPSSAEDPDADIKWVRYKIMQIARKQLAELEIDLLVHEFFLGKDHPSFARKHKMTDRTVRRIKANLMGKLRDSIELHNLWNQAKGIF